MLASGSPFHRALERGGRLYGGWGSAQSRPIRPCASTSWIACAAASAVMPPPTMRQSQAGILLSFLQGPTVLAPPTVPLRRSMNLVRGCLEPRFHGRGVILDPYGGFALPSP